MNSELLSIILGGGGAIGIATVLLNAVKDWRKDRVVREDTALTRLRDDYDRKSRESEKGWRLANWYRNQYFLARDALPLEARSQFPPGPPADIDY